MTMEPSAIAFGVLALVFLQRWIHYYRCRKCQSDVQWGYCVQFHRAFHGPLALNLLCLALARVVFCLWKDLTHWNNQTGYKPDTWYMLTLFYWLQELSTAICVGCVAFVVLFYVQVVNLRKWPVKVMQFLGGGTALIVLWTVAFVVLSPYAYFRATNELSLKTPNNANDSTENQTIRLCYFVFSASCWIALELLLLKYKVEFEQHLRHEHASQRLPTFQLSQINRIAWTSKLLMVWLLVRALFTFYSLVERLNGAGSDTTNETSFEFLAAHYYAWEISLMLLVFLLIHFMPTCHHQLFSQHGKSKDVQAVESQDYETGGGSHCVQLSIHEYNEHMTPRVEEDICVQAASRHNENGGSSESAEGAVFM